MDGHQTLHSGECVNIPIQVMDLTYMDGRVTPCWLRLDAEDHQIQTIRVEKTVCRSDKNFAGILEKQFICLVSAGEEDCFRSIELRYNLETQRWRIVQFL